MHFRVANRNDSAERIPRKSVFALKGALGAHLKSYYKVLTPPQGSDNIPDRFGQPSPLILANTLKSRYACFRYFRVLQLSLKTTLNNMSKQFWNESWKITQISNSLSQEEDRWILNLVVQIIHLLQPHRKIIGKIIGQSKDNHRKTYGNNYGMFLQFHCEIILK